VLVVTVVPLPPGELGHAVRSSGPLAQVIEDTEMGVFQNQHHDRLRSLEKRRSVSIPLGDSPDDGEIPNHSSASGRDTPFRLPALDDASHSGESPKVSPHPHDESSLKTRLNSKHNGSNDELAVI